MEKMKRGHWPPEVFRYGKWIKIHNWTEEEDSCLRREYRYSCQSLKDLGSRLGVTASSVRQRLTRLGLLKLTVWWSPEDEKFLGENYSTMPMLALAKKLHRSPNSVVAKAHRLRVTKRAKDGWFNMGEVAQILGVDQGWIWRRIRRGFKLKRNPHDPERPPKKGTYNAWHISEEALRDFIRRYPEELTGHNVDFVMLVDILAGVK